MAHGIRNLVPFTRRGLLEQSKNLHAVPAPATPSTEQIISLPTTRNSGTFSAVPKKQNRVPTPPPDPTPREAPVSQSSQTSNSEPPAQQSSDSGNLWKYLIAVLCVVILLVIVIVVIIYRKRAAKTTCPWKTGVSGQLQKAFVTGNFTQ